MTDVQVGALDELADRLLTMPKAKRDAWLLRASPEDRALVEKALGPRVDPLGWRTIYRPLGYEPICVPRVLEALAAGHANPIDAEDAGMIDLPAPCGECPAELFDAATEFDVIFGGAAGAAKTRTALMIAVRAMKQYPGFRALLLRETYDQLDENVYPELRAIDYAEAIGGRWEAGRRQLHIGLSTCRFRYLADAEDVLQRRGGSYQLIIFDERNLLPTGIGDGLRDRLRSADPTIPVIGFRSTANPGGKAHGEVKSMFVVPTDYGAKTVHVRVGTAEFDRRFIPGKATDNPYLGPDYEDQVLGGIEDPVLRAAMRDGNFDIFKGQYFCFDDQTEILTASGWTPAAKVRVGEPVATLAPDGLMTFAPASDARTLPYDGDLLVHEGRAVDFAVTPNHRMLTRGRRSSGPFRLVEAQEMPTESVHLRAAGRWDGDDLTPVTIGGVRKWAKRPSFMFDRGDWAELLGWWLAEGFTTRASNRSRYAGRVTGFGISQSASPSKIARIRGLLDRMGLVYSFDGKRFRVVSVVLGEYLGRLGVHHEKYVPREMLQSGPATLGRLFDALMAGDGCPVRRGAWIYASTSRQLADDVQEIAVRLGRVATITRTEPKKPQHRPQYRVAVYQPDHDRSIVKATNVERRRYDGLVACVTVEPHHTVLARRDGKALWTGNSEWDHALHVVPRFEVPRPWARFSGTDYGRAAPWCHLTAGRDNNGRVWVYREEYETGLGEREQARRIKDAERSAGEIVTKRFADPSMWNKTGDADPVAETYRQLGVPLIEAVNDRTSGWARVHTYLSNGIDPAHPDEYDERYLACPYHAERGLVTCPLLHVMDGTAPNLVRTLPDLPFDKHKVEDLDTGSEDHAADALRYLLIMLPIQVRRRRPLFGQQLSQAGIR